MYNNFVNESTEEYSESINLYAMLVRRPYLTIIEEIKPLVVGNYCRWISLGLGKEYKEIVDNVKVSLNAKNQVCIYFNNKSVDPNHTVEIKNEKIEATYDLIGFPSGEVITLSKEKMEMLIKNGLAKYSELLRLNDDIVLKKIFFFNDFRYDEIKKILYPITAELERYKRGDILICKGNLTNISIENEEATVIASGPTGRGIAYYVEFVNPILGKNPSDNRYWLLSDSIIGKKGDVKPEKQMELDFNDLEDYEIDDSYYIDQLFKKKKEKND
jgi:hypothetical protein